MRAITVTTHVPVAREQVFAFVADSTNDPLWCPLVPHTEQIDGAGPGFGAKYRYIQKIRKGGAIEGIITVTDYEPPHRIAWHVEDSARVYRIEMSFDEDESGTRITQVDHPRFKGRYRLVAPLARGKIEAMLRRQFQRLERHLVADGGVVIAAPAH